ncbi:MAG: 50S ribosomal protein L9 [Parcubacteria group bacterium]|nr:50S ribosomal protein L9 [Parcubacteria group bacterium]
MKIILTENIKGLGQIGETLEVKSGYARNFLVPKNLAILATQENLKRVGELKKKKGLAIQEEFERIKQAAESLKNFKLIIETKTDEKGNLYAAISPKTIGQILKERGIEINPDCILISEPIKKVGVHPVLFKFYDIEAPFEIDVVQERRTKLR